MASGGGKIEYDSTDPSAADAFNSAVEVHQKAGDVLLFVRSNVSVRVPEDCFPSAHSPGWPITITIYSLHVLMRLRGGSAYIYIYGQVDCCVHGSAPRKTLSGQRRFVLYRYGPSWANSRYGYPPSVELLRRLTPERSKIMFVRRV